MKLDSKHSPIPNKILLPVLAASIQAYIEDEQTTANHPAEKYFSTWKRATVQRDIGITPRILSWRNVI